MLFSLPALAVSRACVETIDSEALRNVDNLLVNQADPQGPVLRRLKSLTWHFQGQNNDFGDPSPPDFSEPGVVKIYTSGAQVLSWRDQNGMTAVDRFLRGETPQRERLRVTDEHAALGLDPWDMTIEKFPEFAANKVMYAGGMTPQPGHAVARWPGDNWRRRVNAYTFKNDDKGGEWIRVPGSMLGDAPDQQSWIGHSYGHQFVRDEANTLWMFYEKVSEERDGQPFKTEIFARKVNSATELDPNEISILKFSDQPWPSSAHGNGFLMEGARPIKIKSGYLIPFSAGDFNGPNYGINFAFSQKITGPYRPYLNDAKTDLRNFGRALDSAAALKWGAARAVVFQAQGQWWVLFHGIDQSQPNEVKNQQRALFIAPLSLIEQTNPGEAPAISILP